MQIVARELELHVDDRPMRTLVIRPQARPLGLRDDLTRDRVLVEN